MPGSFKSTQRIDCLSRDKPETLTASQDVTCHHADELGRTLDTAKIPQASPVTAEHLQGSALQVKELGQAFRSSPDVCGERDGHDGPNKLHGASQNNAFELNSGLELATQSMTKEAKTGNTAEFDEQVASALAQGKGVIRSSGTDASKDSSEAGASKAEDTEIEVGLPEDFQHPPESRAAIDTVAELEVSSDDVAGGNDGEEDPSRDKSKGAGSAPGDATCLL